MVVDLSLRTKQQREREEFVHLVSEVRLISLFWHWNKFQFTVTLFVPRAHALIDTFVEHFSPLARAVLWRQWGPWLKIKGSVGRDDDEESDECMPAPFTQSLFERFILVASHAWPPLHVHQLKSSDSCVPQSSKYCFNFEFDQICPRINTLTNLFLMLSSFHLLSLSLSLSCSLSCSCFSRLFASPTERKSNYPWKAPTLLILAAPGRLKFQNLTSGCRRAATNRIQHKSCRSTSSCYKNDCTAHKSDFAIN